MVSLAGNASILAQGAIGVNQQIVSTICGKEGVRRVILASVVVFPGGCWGLRGENAGCGWGRGKNFPGMGLAQKRGYDSDKDQEPQPRFFSSRINTQSGLELAAKRRRSKARLRERQAGHGLQGGGGSGFGGFGALRSPGFSRLEDGWQA